MRHANPCATATPSRSIPPVPRHHCKNRYRDGNIAYGRWASIHALEALGARYVRPHRISFTVYLTLSESPQALLNLARTIVVERALERGKCARWLAFFLATGTGRGSSEDDHAPQASAARVRTRHMIHITCLQVSYGTPPTRTLARAQARTCADLRRSSPCQVSVRTARALRVSPT
ncbi:hypothetical protein EI94DRAFT_1017622 [Lactarius quietus]|nr:hypothetical protein EI94DRAFT_1017622 [Lactarius quietus]